MHCIYFKVKREKERPWNCKPSSKNCLSHYCPHKVDTKKLKQLVTDALDPEVRIRRTAGCVRPFDPLDKYRGGRHFTSVSQPDG